MAEVQTAARTLSDEQKDAIFERFKPIVSMRNASLNEQVRCVLAHLDYSDEEIANVAEIGLSETPSAKERLVKNFILNLVGPKKLNLAPLPGGMTDIRTVLREADAIYESLTSDPHVSYDPPEYTIDLLLMAFAPSLNSENNTCKKGPPMDDAPKLAGFFPADKPIASKQLGLMAVMAGCQDLSGAVDTILESRPSSVTDVDVAEDIEDLYKSLGIQKEWSDLAKFESVQELFGAYMVEHPDAVVEAPGKGTQTPSAGSSPPPPAAPAPPRPPVDPKPARAGDLPPPPSDDIKPEGEEASAASGAAPDAPTIPVVVSSVFTADLRLVPSIIAQIARNTHAAVSSGQVPEMVQDIFNRRLKGEDDMETIYTKLDTSHKKMDPLMNAFRKAIGFPSVRDLGIEGMTNRSAGYKDVANLLAIWKHYTDEYASKAVVPDREQQRRYDALVAYNATIQGMDPLSVDVDVLNNELTTRSRVACIVEESPTWFHSFFAERVCGIDGNVPSYCNCDGVTDWEQIPALAAVKAAQIYEVLTQIIPEDILRETVRKLHPNLP